MTTLEPGLRLVEPAETPFAGPRVWVNGGVEPAPPDAGYRAGAFVPKADWREATPAERDVIAGGATEPGCVLRCVRVPAAAVEPLWRLGFDRIATEAEYAVRTSTREFRPALAEAATALRVLCRDGTEPTVLGVCYKPAGLRTVTVHPAGGFVGLHLDRWDRQPLAGRSQSRTRLCVNLGPEPRAFEYVNLPLRRVLDLGDGDPSGLTDPDGWQPAIVGFLRRFPTYPLVRVLIGPGEAYIAPTENFVHDGCTVGRTVPDVTLNMVGHFDPAAV